MHKLVLNRFAWFALIACAPLTSSIAAMADGLYAGHTPPLEIESVDTVSLVAADDQRPVPLQIFYPRQGGPYPLIVLSHGTFSSIHRYDRIAAYWAGQGYVVILPQHKDANYGVRPTGYAVMQDVTRTRVADMTLVLDELDSIEKQLSALVGKIDRGRYIAAGHSIGTQVAMLVTGLSYRNGFDDEVMASAERRYIALVLISDPGKMRLMPADTWTAGSVPTFMATGTDDYGLMGARGESAEAQSTLLSSGEDSAEVARYLLLLDGGDHYFGGLIQKDVKAEPDYQGLAIFNAISTAFMDAVVKDDDRARAWLDTIDLPGVTAGRASLEKD